MKRMFLVSCLLALAATVSFAQDTGKPDGANVFSNKVAELTLSVSNRLDKVLAIHTFVRDQISQSATQWG